jgi:lipopolysaccharide/colanic/teichoic acid biosynthesis glycosyltransferase
MAIVGPRPEDPSIVRRYYTVADWQTLEVRPGLTSPGTLYYYTQCEPVLIGDDVTRVYGEQLLPRKLAIDREYVRNARFFDDLRTILQTVVVLAGRVLRCREVRERPAT